MFKYPCLIIKTADTTFQWMWPLLRVEKPQSRPPEIITTRHDSSLDDIVAMIL